MFVVESAIAKGRHKPQASLGLETVQPMLIFIDDVKSGEL